MKSTKQNQDLNEDPKLNEESNTTGVKGGQASQDTSEEETTEIEDTSETGTQTEEATV